MEKPKYLLAIIRSLYIIIVILTIIKLYLDFTECVYNATVISDIIFNFIILICAIILFILYKSFLIRLIVNYISLLSLMGALITSILSYQYIINDSKMKAIYNFSSYTKLAIVFASFMLNILEDEDDDY